MSERMDELLRFLVQAKRKTYASQQGMVASSRPGAKDLRYQASPYIYVDSYFGDKDFSGQEVVYHNDSPVWSMNYYGRMLREEVPPGFIETLREALLRVERGAPYRGIAHYLRGAYVYRCHWEGTPQAFHGEESITWEGQEVYRLHFHGGRIR